MARIKRTGWIDGTRTPTNGEGPYEGQLLGTAGYKDVFYDQKRKYWYVKTMYCELIPTRERVDVVRWRGWLKKC